MNQPQLIIRCDYGEETTGWGHIVRCSALAALALSQGIHTILVTRTQNSELTKEIRSTFSEIVSIPHEEAFYEWLKTKKNTSLAVVTDSHDYTSEHILQLRNNTLTPKQPLFVITDFVPPVNLQLPGLTFIFAGIYAEMIRSTIKNPQTLIGLQYTLIRNKFSEAIVHHSHTTHSKTPSDYNIKKCVIMMGGIDYSQSTPKALDYLYKALGKDAWPIVIHRKQNSDAITAIENSLKKFTNSTWLEKLNTTEVAQLFLESDFAITACGGTIHELAVCNLPFVGLIVIDNQLPFSQGISKLWSLPIFDIANLNESDLITAIQKTSELKKLNYHFHPTLDTQGAKRILNAIINALKN